MYALDPEAESAQAARSQITNELNQIFRRLRQYRTEPEWSSAILDGASQFARQLALFAHRDGFLYLRGQKKLNLAEDFSFSATGAAAFENAINSKDAVIALRTSAEVGRPLSSPDSQDRAHIIPVLNGPRVVALLFAAGEDHLDFNAIELISGLAATVLERQSNASLHTQIAASSVPPIRPSLADLSEDQRALHIRARRLARVKTAEMQLSRPEACEAGRQQNNLYVFIREEIEKARDIYRRQFMSIPSMVDYLHLELVRTLSGGEERKLGAEYPGQLL